MAKYQGKQNRLVRRKKKRSELGSDPTNTKFSDKEQNRKARLRGGKEKTVAITAGFANVAVDGRTKKVKITAVDDNPANKDFKRENVLTRGGLVETELGKARITSRPSQDGIVNAVLVK